MDAAVRADWLAALRGGEYEQGKMFLRTPDGKFCCLGVLCDLAEKAGIVEACWSDGVWTYGGESKGLPFEVMEWAGLDSWAPCAADGYYLADHNDGAPCVGDHASSFAEIADMIEEAL
jgi:hypothetical protein